MREVFGLTRRQILAGIAVGLVAPVPALACAPGLHAYLHESGKPGKAGAFVLGGLFTDSPAALAGALAEARRRTQFLAPLRYASTSRFKEGYARAAVDAFLHDAAARFAAVRLPGWPDGTAARRAAYHDAYLSLLRGQPGTLVLHRPAHRTIGPDGDLDGYLAAQLPGVRLGGALGGDVAELAAFLTGSIAAARRGGSGGIKGDLARHVAAQLDGSAKVVVTAA